MQLFNETNSRFLDGAPNVFRGMHRTPLFCSILLVMAVLQVVMVKFRGQAMHVTDDGLSAKCWILSLALGAASLPIQQAISLHKYVVLIVERLLL